MSSETKDQPEGEDFAAAASGRDTSLVRELIGYLGNNKKWWLTPIIVVMLAVAALIILGGTGAAPLIYTLF